MVTSAENGELKGSARSNGSLHIKKILEKKFTNADSIRNLEDNNQLALKLWNLPKFESFDQLKKWLDKEYVY